MIRRRLRPEREIGADRAVGRLERDAGAQDQGASARVVMSRSVDGDGSEQ